MLVRGWIYESRAPGVQVREDVVGVCDGNGDILGTVAVGVTDQGGLPVVVQYGVGYGDASASVGDIEETVVAV